MNRPYLTGLPSSWQARIEARRGRAEHALEQLGEAFAQGGQFDLWLHTDADLESLRDHPRFQALLQPRN